MVQCASGRRMGKNIGATAAPLRTGASSRKADAAGVAPGVAHLALIELHPSLSQLPSSSCIADLRRAKSIIDTFNKVTARQL